MKRKDIQALKEKPMAELEKLLHESRRTLLRLRFDLKAGKLKDIDEMRKVKKTIARILTFLRENKEKAQDSSNKNMKQRET